METYTDALSGSQVRRPILLGQAVEAGSFQSVFVRLRRTLHVWPKTKKLDVRPVSPGWSVRKTVKKKEGFTLVELMIVVIILALIATGVTVALLPRLDEANKKTAKTDAQQIRSAATLWIADHAGKCPSVQDLMDDGILDKSKRTKDPWDNDFSISCEGGDLVVTSAGKDGQFGTEDDVK